MASESYNNANSILEKRRLAMRAKYLEKQDEILSAVPEIEGINDEISNVGASIAIATIKKHTEDAVALRKRMDELEAQRTQLLLNNGFSPEDIEMQYYCPICKDTGFVKGKICSCMKNEILKQKQKVLSELSPAPNYTFDEFRLEYYSKQAIQLDSKRMTIPYDQMKYVYDYCVSYANNFSLNNRSLLMLGYAGLGKTHLACSIANVCIRNGFTVMYSSAQSLFYKIEQSKYSDDDVLTDILNCDLFILDDLGAEHMTQYSVSVLYNIVNTRMITSKPCIITSNILMKSDMQRRYGEKISSRLLGSYVPLNFIGQDIRIEKNRQRV